MDCIDCHNRPAHAYQTPNQAVETDMALGKISTNLPYVKKTAVEALTKDYSDTDRAFEGIAAALRRKYGASDEVAPAIATVQRIYQEDFFPKMKADWRTYPNNIGHKTGPVASVATTTSIAPSTAVSRALERLHRLPHPARPGRGRN